MSTTEIVPAIKTENKDYRVYLKLDNKGLIDDVKLVSTENQFKALDKADSGYTLAGEQTVKMIKFGTVEGFLLAVPDPEAQLDIINRGTSIKIAQKLNAVLTELTDKSDNLVFEFGTQDVLETINLIQEGPKRQKLSDIDKLLKSLQAMNLPESVIQATIAQIKTAQLKAEQAESEAELESVSA
jgi:hypothetical protein